MSTEHPKQIKIREKVWDVDDIVVTARTMTLLGGEEEFLYILSGWGEDPICYFDWQIDDLIKDGAAKIIS